MTVTVLTACYDTPARMIRDYWASLLGQTLADWRLVLVDDGSTDPETVAELDRIAADPRACLIRLPENRGLAAALNRGLAECVTEWAARLDPDDIARPDWLAAQLAYIAAHPDADIVGCQLELFDDATGAVLHVTGHAEVITQAILDAQIAREFIWFTNHGGVFYRPSQILALGGYSESPAHVRAEDGELWLRAWAAGLNFRVNPSALQRYRRWPH